MKVIIEEYGHLAVMALIGALILVWTAGSFRQQMRESVDIGDAAVRTGNIQSELFRIPEFQGLEKDGEPLALKIAAGTILHPLDTEGILRVTASDRVDGDLTERIRVYLISAEDGKEKRTRIEGVWEVSEPNRQYILLYAVSNSAGFEAEARISILTDGTGGKP